MEKGYPRIIGKYSRLLRPAFIGPRISFYDRATLIQLLVITSPLFWLIIRWMHRSSLGEVAPGTARGDIRICDAALEYIRTHVRAS